MKPRPADTATSQACRVGRSPAGVGAVARVAVRTRAGPGSGAGVMISSVFIGGGHGRVIGRPRGRSVPPPPFRSGFSRGTRAAGYRPARRRGRPCRKGRPPRPCCARPVLRPRSRESFKSIEKWLSQPSEAAGVEDERGDLPGGVQVVHTEHDDVVVARPHLLVDGAVEPRGRALDEDTAVLGRSPPDTGEPVAGAGAEPPPDLLLVGAEH